MTQVNKNGVVLQKFVYDGDGRCVKSEAHTNGALTETILFIGAHYEVKNNSEVTKYYFAGTSRIAVKKYTVPRTMIVEYFLSDHLGSTTITLDSNGPKISEMRYKAWGEVRYTWSASQTTTPSYILKMYTYTGQASYMDDPTTNGATEGFGLARWYDPSLGRFAQADSIVPGGSQGLDRYGYANNSPLVYADPSGHDPWYCETAACEGKYSNRFSTRTIIVPLRESEEGSSILEIHELLEDKADAIRNGFPMKVINNAASTAIGLITGEACGPGAPICAAISESVSNALGSAAEDAIKDPDAEKYDEVADTLLVAANDRNTKNIDTIKVHLTPWEATAVSLVSVDEYGYQTLNDIEPHYSLTIEGTSESITLITQSQARYINYLFGGGLLP